MATDPLETIPNILMTIVKQYPNISDAIHAVKKQLPFMHEETISNLITDFIQHKKNHHSIKLDVENKFNENDPIASFKMDWMKICECVSHEMWPKLSSIIKSIINENNIDIHKIKNESKNMEENKYNSEINRSENSKIIVDKLKKRNIEIEAIQYLEKLIQRAVAFKLMNNNQIQIYNINQINNNHHDNMMQLLLTDIYTTHKLFIFTNFNFEEYNKNDFKKDIKKHAITILGENTIEQYSQHVESMDEVNLYPSYLVNDNVFEIFEYHFAISYYLNYLKHGLFIENGQRFQLKAVVIPSEITCVYDSNVIFHKIGRMMKYLSKKKVNNFCAFQINRNKIKSISDIKTKIIEEYDVEDIQLDKTYKLVMIVVRSAVDYDMMYIFPNKSGVRFDELDMNYFIGFNHMIIHTNGTNSVISHFTYGVNQQIRFWPELLTTYIPRLFVKQINVSEAQFLDKIFDISFKNGWCVTLNDNNFNKFYKILTGFTHCSVNFNRSLLYKEINNEIPMLCFTEILFDELTSAEIEANDIEEFKKYMDENEYDTETMIADIEYDCDSSQSNIKQYFQANKKCNQFTVIRNIINKFNAPSQKGMNDKICGYHTHKKVFEFEDCSFISVIIDALKQFNEKNQFKIKKSQFNLSDLLGAYDHIISVHDFYKAKPNNDMPGNVGAENVKNYIV
eukprot:34714_1